MYSEDIYGLQKYAADSGTSDPEEEYFVDLSRYAPPFLAKLREMEEIYRTEGRAAGRLRHDLEDLASQCSIVTATWGLSRWEAAFGIGTNRALTYEQRREILTAKLRGQGTTTRKMIKETAAAFSGGEVEVVENNPENYFIVRFIGIKGIPRNMQAFINMLEDIKPAHLAYEFQYMYTVWNNLAGMTWNSMAMKTYDEVKVMEGV